MLECSGVCLEHIYTVHDYLCKFFCFYKILRQNEEQIKPNVCLNWGIHPIR